MILLRRCTTKSREVKMSKNCWFDFFHGLVRFDRILATPCELRNHGRIHVSNRFLTKFQTRSREARISRNYWFALFNGLLRFNRIVTSLYELCKHGTFPFSANWITVNHNKQTISNKTRGTKSGDELFAQFFLKTCSIWQKFDQFLQDTPRGDYFSKMFP